MKNIALLCTVSILLIFCTGCAAFNKITDVTTNVAASAGLVSHRQAESIGRVAKSSGRAFESFTPQQEHYIGRSVGATLLLEYSVVQKKDVTRYINELGQVLAVVSDKPETYAGYRFLILDTDEVNAYAAPGGLILVTRGLLQCSANEDELAAILAHEIAHIQEDHGLKAIRKGRITEAISIGLVEGAKQYTSEQVGKLADSLEGSVADITDTLANGYDRKLEYTADAAAMVILQRLGYSPRGLRGVLRKMAERTRGQSGGFAKTHPDPADRLQEIDEHLHGMPPLQVVPARQSRFEAAMRGIL